METAYALRVPTANGDVDWTISAADDQAATEVAKKLLMNVPQGLRWRCVLLYFRESANGSLPLFNP